MTAQPELVLHVVPFSHPCLAVTAALDRFGLSYETVELPLGKQAEAVEEIYGEGRRTVPGMLVDGEPVHGTTAIFERIDALVGGGRLYPEATAYTVREVERGLAEDIQTAARVLVFGVLHFRPEVLGTFAGTGPLDPAGTDFAIRLVRGAWRYIGITAERIAGELEALPGHLDRVDALIAEGVLGGDEPCAADFQIGSSLQLLAVVGDLRPLLVDRPCETLARDLFERNRGDVPAGAFPAGWVPEPAAA